MTVMYYYPQPSNLWEGGDAVERLRKEKDGEIKRLRDKLQTESQQKEQWELRYKVGFQEHEREHKRKVEELKREFERKHERKVGELKREFERERESNSAGELKREFEREHESNSVGELKREFEREHESKVEELKREFEREHESKVEELKREFERKHDSKVGELKREFERKYEQTVEELKRKFESHYSALLQQHKSVDDQDREELRKGLESYYNGKLQECEYQIHQKVAEVRTQQTTIQVCEREVERYKGELERLLQCDECLQKDKALVNMKEVLERERLSECQKRECNAAKEKLRNPCERHDCTSAKQQLEMEVRQLKSESGPCTRSDCRKAHGVQDRVTQLVKENQKLERDKEAERNRTKKTQDKKDAEIEELKKQPCTKYDCRSKREKVDKLTREKEEWEQRKQHHKEEYRKVKNKLDELERKPCTYRACQNAYGERILSVLGRNTLSDGSQELTVNQSLEHIDGKLTVILDRLVETSVPSQEHLQEGKCQNEECLKMKRGLERKVKELESLLYAEKCQKPECAKLRRDLKQKELAEMGKSGNVGTNLQKMTGAEHSELIHEFEAVTTNPEGILGELEDAVDTFDAKRILSRIFQLAYDSCKELAVVRISKKIETLFTVNKEADREDMEDTSRGYGLLLHGAGLKAEQVIAEHVSAVAEKVCSEFSGTTIYDKVKTVLQPGNPHLEKVVLLTWKFITLPSPLIICQPATFSEQLQEPEYGYWDKSVRPTELIYLRPVVYRSYQGILACKAWVANTVTPVATQNEEQEAKPWYSKVTSALGFN